MKLSYVAIGSRPYLPSKIEDYFGDMWTGGENPTNKRVHDLLCQDGQYGKVLSGNEKLLTWDMNGDAGSFSILAPEVFHMNRVILVPPQGINLDPLASGKGRVKVVQSALLAIIKRNTFPGVDTCLSALIDYKKKHAIGPHLLNAGYYELGEKAGCVVYVHSETQQVQDAVGKLLGGIQ